MALVLGFLHYFVFGFSRHLTLLGVLLLIGGIVFARVGHAYGIDRLFWHERGSLQFRAGLSTALLFAKVGFVGYLLDEASLRSLPAFSGTLPTERVLAAALYIALLTLPVALCWMLLALLSHRTRRASDRVPRAWFIVGAAVGWLGSLTVLVTFARFVPTTPATPAWLVTLLFLHDVPAALRPLHVLGGIFMAALSGEYLVYLVARQRFTPAMAICTLLGLFAGITGFFAFRAWNVAGIALALLLATALGGLPRRKVRLAALRERYRSPEPLERYLGAARPCPYPLIESEHVPWASEGEKRPLVLVCASGGGLRSALWTAEVLCELELALSDFSRSLRIIAGASGGMVGAAAYALTLRSDRRARDWAHHVPRAELLARLGRDSLSATVKRMVFHDLPLALLPIPNWSSRGEALEACWQTNMGGAFDPTFGDLLERERSGELPSLVFSPMLVEDGRRLIISNLDLDFVTDNEAIIDGTRLSLSRSGFELARLFPAEFARFPVRTAARLSAAFPYVSPAVNLPTEPVRRAVDAGYYDNFGVNICAAWLADCLCNEARRRHLEQNVSRILIVQVRDRVSPLHGVSSGLTGERGAFGRGLEGLFSPVQGVLSSRESVSVFRNDEQLEQVIRLYDQRFSRGFVRTEIFEYPGEASLSWYLTRAERAAITRAARELDQQLDGLRSFWFGERARSSSHGIHIANPHDSDGVDASP